MTLHLNQSDIDVICRPFFDTILEHKFKVHLTVGGNIAVVLNINAGGWAPLLGAYYTGSSPEDGEWLPAKWCSDGKFPSINHKLNSTKLDLIMANTPEKDAA